MANGSSPHNTLYLALLFATLLACLPGCDRGQSGEPSEASAPPTPADQPRDPGPDISHLRALPYAGGVAEEEDDASADGVTINEGDQPSPGYTLYTIQPLSRADLIDNNGQVVHSWNYSPSDRWERAELLPNGDLLVVGVDENEFARGQGIPDDARYVLRYTWSGELLWKKQLKAHHDIEFTPAGDLLVLTLNVRSVPQIHPKIGIRDDQLTLLNSDGTVKAEYSLLDAIEANPTVFPLDPVRPSTKCGVTSIDLFHSNSAEWMRNAQLATSNPIYDLNNVLVCSRHQNRIAIFDWDDKQVVWSWGRDELMGPHDAQVLENGNILVFDNGLGRGWSRVIELDPTSGKIVWQYKADPPDAFFSSHKGSAQRLPNGNTLISESARGRIFEITSDGEIVWEFFCPHRTPDGERATIVRAIRHAPEVIEPLLQR